jgi:TRAP-type C4-dicarboxylate transport system substrate-binding protein
MLTEMTDGQIIVETYPGGSLYGSTAAFNAVATGSAEVFFEAPYYAASGALWLYIHYTTGIWLSWEHQKAVLLDDIYIDKLNETLGPAGVHALGSYPSSMLTGFVSRIETTDMRDFEGVTFGLRTGSNPVPINDFGGFSYVSVPNAEMWIALEQGIIDSAATGLGNATGEKLWEIVDNCHLIVVGSSSNTVVINQDAYDALPTEYQDFLDNEFHLAFFDWAHEFAQAQEKIDVDLIKENFKYVYADTPAQIAEYWEIMKDMPGTQFYINAAGEDIIGLLESTM